MRSPRKTLTVVSAATIGLIVIVYWTVNLILPSGSSNLGDQSERLNVERGTNGLTDPYVLAGLVVIGLISGASALLFRLKFPPAFSAFSTPASMAIQNARLYEQNRQRAIELEALRKAMLGLTSSLNLDQVLTAVLENVLQLTSEAQNAHIFLYQDHRLVFGAALWSDGHRGQQVSEPRENGLTYTVARQGKIIAVPDMRNHPLFSDMSPAKSQGAIIGLPIKVENTLLGVMNVAFAKPRLFDAAEQNVLQLFADQAGFAIANARLHQAVQESETRYRSLIDNIPIAIYRVTPGPQGKFLMANPAYLTMFGYSSFAELQQTQVCDLYTDPHDRQIFSDQVIKAGQVSAREQKLRKKDGTLIWVIVNAQAVYQDNRVIYFDCTALDITARKRETLSRTVAEDALRQRTRELEALLEVSSSATHLDLQTVLSVVVNRARNLLNATEAMIFLMDEKEDLLQPVVVLGNYVEERLRLRVHPGEGIVGWVAQQREAVIINHAMSDSRIRHVPGTPEEDESMLCAPLIHGAHLQGVILLNRIPAIGFTQSELDLLVGLAAQASGAVANARLFEETRRNALEQKIVTEISIALNSTLDVAKTFPVVVKGIRALAECDRISLALLDADNQHFTMVVLDEPHVELAKGTRLPITVTACAPDILSRREHFTADLSTETEYAAERILYDAGYRSRINLPLIVGERSVGALNLVSRQFNAFDRAPRVPLQQIANVLAMTLENAQLFQAEQNRREELATLYRLSRQLADLNTSESVVSLVVQQLVETLHVTYARLSLIEGNDYVTRSVYPIHLFDPDRFVGLRAAMNCYPSVETLLQASAPVILERTDARLSPPETQMLFVGSEPSICLVPLHVNARPIGFITLGEPRVEEREPLPPEKIRLARNIGDQAGSALHRLELFAELESAYLQSVLALANTVDAKDSDTNLHSQRLSELALLTGKKLGLSPHDLDDLRYGAMLHDIGKIGVPDSILKKPEPLDTDEWQQMQQHPLIGERILAPLPRLAHAAKIVRHHHERYDGTGYPDRLAQDEIPIGARILTIVDSYGAIIDERIYKKARSHDEAVAEIRRCGGSQFDPHIVEVFVQVLKEQSDPEQTP